MSERTTYNIAKGKELSGENGFSTTSEAHLELGPSRVSGSTRKFQGSRYNMFL